MYEVWSVSSVLWWCWAVYVPEMQSKHLVKLVMMAGIVNPRQNSPVDFLFDSIDKFDHPAGGTSAQGPDLTSSLSTRAIWRTEFDRGAVSTFSDICKAG